MEGFWDRRKLGMGKFVGRWKEGGVGRIFEGGLLDRPSSSHVRRVSMTGVEAVEARGERRLILRNNCRTHKQHVAVDLQESPSLQVPTVLQLN